MGQRRNSPQDHLFKNILEEKYFIYFYIKYVNLNVSFYAKLFCYPLKISIFNRISILDSVKYFDIYIF